MRRVAVVGAGIVGLAVAHRLQRVDPGTQVIVIEKEPQVATHQTGHNSGVIHSGLYYAPGSLKAQLCVSGAEMMKKYCAAHSVPVATRGKLVVAVDVSELAGLEDLYRRGVANGVPGLELVDGRRLRELEPHAAGLRGLHSPTTSVVDYRAVARALAEEVGSEGGELRLGTEVLSLQARGSGTVVLELSGRHPGRLECDFAYACAGLQSDRLATRSGADAEPRIIPFRGLYYKLRGPARALVRGLIYPVPDPRYPFLGIHLTRTAGDEVLVGPNAFLAFAREAYGATAFDWQDLKEAVTWPGFRKFALSHWRAGARELYHTLTRTGFAGAVRRYVPDLSPEDLEPSTAGIRAQAMRRDGSLVDDFWLEEGEGILYVRNAPSPAATSAFSIAEHVCRQAGIG